MIEAIIFDCFGVLTTDGWEPFCKKYFKEPTKLSQAKDLVGSLNLGKINYPTFIARVSELADVSTSVASKHIDDNRPNNKLFDFIRRDLKPHYKIALLSNAGSNWLNELFLPSQLELFSDVVLSVDVGLIKPNPNIYQLAAQRLKTKAQNIVFVDDIDRYVVGAKDIGMKGIVYKNFNQFKNELGTILKES